jgi:uncharacterized phage infection (PIP) family protein YhgE
MNFGTGDVTAGSFTDSTGDLRTGLNTLTSNVNNIDNDVVTLETWRSGTVTPTLSDFESRISTLESQVAADLADLAAYKITVGDAINHIVTQYNAHTHGGGAGPSPTM